MKIKMSLLMISLVGVFAITPASARTKAERKTERGLQECYVVLSSGGLSSPIEVRARPNTNAAVVVRVGHRASIYVIDSASGGWKKIIYRRGSRRYVGWIPEEYVWC
jgi:hypothetical protein